VPNFDYLKSKKIVNAREILRDEIARLSNQLPKYKRLMSYQIQGEPLPRTTSRKIKRVELKKLAESRQPRGPESIPIQVLPKEEDKALMESAIGQEVAKCLRETYHRSMPIDASMNLELDLGFDSMERVELLASLEQALNLKLPDDFGTEILTVRDLIVLLEQQTGALMYGGAAARQSWKNILSEDSTYKNEEAEAHFASAPMAIFKHLCLRLIHFLLLRTFLRLETRGLENLPADGPYLMSPNHASFLDPFIIISALPYRIFRKVFFVGYSEFFSNRLMKLAARLANIVPVDPDAHLLRAMKAGAYGLKRGRILCIFPEGRRSYDGELQEFKKGAAILSRELSVPIVPVAIEGTHKVWPKDSLRIRPHKVKVIFGKPISPAQRSEADPYQADTDELQTAVAKLLSLLRK
jgi:long-chain acyl-CoA synthetase